MVMYMCESCAKKQEAQNLGMHTVAARCDVCKEVTACKGVF